MKQGFELSQNEPIHPRISIVEKNTIPKKRGSIERAFSAIPDSHVQNPNEISPEDRRDIFAKAYKSIVGNVELEKMVIKGMRSMRQGNLDLYSNLTNILTEKCLSLSDREIDDITRLFISGLQKNITTYRSELNLSESEILEVQSFIMADGKGLRGIETGIKSVAYFIRARKKLHKLKPETIPVFYFENHLDARHKIDLVEVIERREGAILNLIQVKSREYTHGEIEESVESHKDWVNYFTVDLKAYESNYSSEPVDSEEYREFILNKDRVDNIFLDILTGEPSMGKEEFYKNLRIDKRTKLEKIWILEHYLPFLKQEVENLMSNGVLDNLAYQKAQNLFIEMSIELEKELKHRNNLTGISEIHTIATVAERIVHDEVIFTATGSDRKAIKIQR